MELQYKQEQHLRKSLVICRTQFEGGLFLKKLRLLLVESSIIVIFYLIFLMRSAVMINY